ncbi:hypothetical protein Tco_0593258, partial [Tanacetum coccineum]
MTGMSRNTNREFTGCDILSPLEELCPQSLGRSSDANTGLPGIGTTHLPSGDQDDRNMHSMVLDTTSFSIAVSVSLESFSFAVERPPVNKRRQKRDVDEVKENAPAKVLRMDHVSIRPERSTCGGKSTAAPMEGVSEPDPLSFSQLQPNLEQDIAQSSKKAAVPEGQDLGKSASFTSMVEPPEGIYQPGWGVTNECRLDTPAACQDLVDHLVPPGYFSVLRHMPNEDFLSQYNVNLAQQVAMGSQLRLRFEQETRLLKKALARAQVTSEEKIRAAFEEFKKHQEDEVAS